MRYVGGYGRLAVLCVTLAMSLVGLTTPTAALAHIEIPMPANFMAENPILDAEAVPSEPGLKVVSVLVKLTNLQPEATLAYAPEDFSLADMDGRQYTRLGQPSKEPVLASGVLQPQETAEGYIAWEVPRTAWPQAVYYQAQGGGFGMSQGLPLSLFSDVDSPNPFFESIGRLKYMGVLEGYPDGTFHPYDEVLRQQMAKLLVLAFERHTQDVADISPFTDVTPALGSPYPFDFINESSDAGYFAGTEGRFLPKQPLTRLQLATVLGRAAVDLPEAPPYPPYAIRDLPTVSPEVAKVLHHGIMLGRTDGFFDPWGSATRGQVAAALERLLKKLENLPPTEAQLGQPTRAAPESTEPAKR
jgi:hypothetical protein